MISVPTYFLGANSPDGFYSLYSELIDPKCARTIYLLKGGAGCGKSTLMRQVEQAVRSVGLETEQILCSGDPDSLDGILLPELGVAIADATAPHVLEPKFPGAVERYINLGDCYDYAALHAIRTEIMEGMRGYQDCYKRAYRCLEAARELREDVRSTLLSPPLREKLARRARGVLRRELKGTKNAPPGKVKQRFLSAITHRGQMTLFETAELQCSRVYVLQDNYGLGHEFLLELLTGAVKGGYDVVACPDPMAPDRLQHLLVPEADLAFVTSTPAQPYPGEGVRKLRLDTIADTALVRSSRPRLRFAQKVSTALIEEAISSLAQAKEMHDKLEALYNPHVDFGRVHVTADQITQEILSLG